MLKNEKIDRIYIMDSFCRQRYN